MLAFSRAITGLRVAEQNLYVTSNNLSNVETDGYHRQRLVQYSFKPETRGNLHIGLGVDSDTIQQTRLEFLETNYRKELASYGEYNYKDKIYTSLQSIIGDDGSYLQDTLTDMWESFNELSKEYTTTIAGSYLRENAVSLIAEFDGINDQLEKVQSELDQEVVNTVRKINDYCDQIAKLNIQITKSEADGSLSCELRDSRDAVIAELSKLVDVEVEYPTDTCVNIRAANGYLVVRNDVNKLAVDKNVPGSTLRYPIWESTGESFEVNSGELKGILDMRGGADVICNLEHSSNGNVKEKMDVVVSIDTKMDFDTLQDMAKNFKNMLDIFDRQGVNYQLYLTNGSKVSTKDLGNFIDHLYAESAKLELDNAINNGVTTFSGLQEYLGGLYGNDSELSNDIWAYLEKNGIDFDGFKAYVEANETDTEALTKIQELFSKYEKEGETSVKGFLSFLEKAEVSDEITKLQGYVSDYVDTLPLDVNDIKNYIDSQYNTVDVSNVSISNSENVLANIRNATAIDFRDDSNKYLMVFTDDVVTNLMTKDYITDRLNESGMNLIAVTDNKSKDSWREIAEKSEGMVLDIKELAEKDGGETLGLEVTRGFNAKLNGVYEENGVAYFRGGLNSLLNGMVREINGIMRQGVNGYGNRHGEPVLDNNKQPVLDPETGDPMYYNLDLFVKIDEDLPLQMGNIKINPAYDDVMNIPLSYSGDTGDFQIGSMLVDLISTDIFNSMDDFATIEEHYANFMLDFGQAANRALTGFENQSTVLTTAKDRISQVSGVSMDEELSNMVKFQYSYTAASKMVRVIDEMLETLINI